MFKKLKQTKQLEKEQEKRDKELKENIERLRTLIRSSFYPWLKKNTKNVEEASIFCQVLAGAIHQAFNLLLKKVTMGEIDTMEFLKNDEDKKKYEEVLEFVRYETINDALQVFEGMPKAISMCVNKELKGRLLEELKELEEDFK